MSVKPVFNSTKHAKPIFPILHDRVARSRSGSYWRPWIYSALSAVHCYRATPLTTGLAFHAAAQVLAPQHNLSSGSMRRPLEVR